MREKETVWRSKPTKKLPKGERWRFLSVGYPGSWMMVRVKDGHRMFCRIEDMEEEK